MRARIRSVRPEMLDDPAFARMGTSEAHRARCERTWVRLQMLADDFGKVVDDPFMLRNCMYPANRTVTEEEVDDELWTLAEHGKVTRYEAATGHLVIHIGEWDDVQHPQKPKASVLPDFDHTSRMRTRDGYLLDESGTDIERVSNGSVVDTGPVPDEYATRRGLVSV